MAVRGFTANIGYQEFVIFDNNKIIRSFAAGDPTMNFQSRIPNGRELICHGVCISPAVNDLYIMTTKDRKKEDIFAFLMNRYNLPLLREWVPYFLTYACKELMEVEIKLYGEKKQWEDVIVYKCCMTEERLQELVSQGLRNKLIWISKQKQKELAFDNMDDYFQKYGHTLVQNLENKLNPLMPLKDRVEELAFLTRRFYPQQAAIVNGLDACLNHSSYAFVNEDMGCGKTLQSMGTVDLLFNKWYLKRHPKRNVRDIYMDASLVTYRAIVMCPSHLTEKWAASIKEDIPYSKVTIIHGLKELIALRKKGKARTAREYYIMSKDTGKLSYPYIPLPYQEKIKEVRHYVCSSCGEDRADLRKPCTCGSNEWHMESEGYREVGLICPDCGELLFPADVKTLRLGKELEDRHMPLTAADFAGQTAANHQCRHCGSVLWVPGCSPLDDRFLFYEQEKRKTRWMKISHFANKAKKGKKTVWVLKKDIKNYIALNELEEEEINYPEIYGPRRYAPSRYIKKHMKGFFDVAIFDEAHELKGGASAQGLSMHDLVKATNKQLVLTGTIAGGYASHFFYLLYRLDPGRMKEKGFEYGSAGERKFVEAYGTLETEYEMVETGEYNSMSRGKMLSTPKCRPGISPLIFSEFLLDKAVFLNLTDMSSFLPPLIEKVEFIDLEDEISREYEYTRKILKKRMREKHGKTLLGSFLQYSLSYTDKPYGRSPILSPMDGSIIAKCADCSHLIKDGKLLNKERRLVEIVNEELAENRNIFVYCDYTGDGETNVTYRLKEILEKNCSLAAGKIEILESAYPPAVKREEWMHEKAAEGVRVFITNPKCVRTGLDFCFKYGGKLYNFPTIVFYQTGYDMFTVWQASRRHFRLNQLLECHTYYLVSARTIQPAAVELVASKQVATSAIQGQFSSEGLCTMAQGVDARIKLAQAVADQSGNQEKGLKSMFDVLNKNNYGTGVAKEYVTMPNFYELTGLQEIADMDDPLSQYMALNDMDILDILSIGMEEEEHSATVQKETIIDAKEQDPVHGLCNLEDVGNMEDSEAQDEYDPLLLLLGI